jgi:hypothetical protein
VIPAWNISAVLPPVRPGAQGHSPDRSPYLASISKVVERFATTPDRIKILRGLLAYRVALGQRGISSGFQWLDGSFMEHKEALGYGSPNDVDVVTFFHLPPGTDEQSFSAQISDLFDIVKTKQTYQVDGYPHLLGRPMEGLDVKLVSYWYSMWSHRRNGLWKGFVQVDVSPVEDKVAIGLLKQIEREAANQ